MFGTRFRITRAMATLPGSEIHNLLREQLSPVVLEFGRAMQAQNTAISSSLQEHQRAMIQALAGIFASLGLDAPGIGSPLVHRRRVVVGFDTRTADTMISLSPTIRNLLVS